MTDAPTDRPRPRGRSDRDTDIEPGDDAVEAGEWYWDRRTEKVYYARETAGDTVEFVTVWHAEEASDALSTGAVVPLGEMAFNDDGHTFDRKDSFRTPPPTELEREDE